MALSSTPNPSDNLQAWNQWRENHPESDVDFRGADFSGADLHGVDLSGANLYEADLSEANLVNADLRGANVQGASFQEANLHGASLDRVQAQGADFGLADLTGSTFRRAQLLGTAFHAVDARGAVFDDARMGSALRITHFESADLRGVDFSQVDTWEVRLDQSDLRGADFRCTITDENLSLCDFRGANLNGAHLIGCDLSESDFRGCDVRDITFIHSNIRNTDFRGTDLSGAVIRATRADDANFQGATLTDADLYDSSFEGASLRGTDLKQATLHGARLGRCDLTGANLQGAYLAAADLDDATLREVNIGGADLSPRFQTSESSLHIAQPGFPELPPYDFKPVRAFQKATARLFEALGLTAEIETTLDHVWQQTYALSPDNTTESEVVLSSAQANQLFEYIQFYVQDYLFPLEERPPPFPNSPVDSEEIHEGVNELARAWDDLLFVGSEHNVDGPNLIGVVGPVVLAATPPNSSDRTKVEMLNSYEMDQLRGKSGEQREENINVFVDTYTAKATR